jgi:hypothetical protein
VTINTDYLFEGGRKMKKTMSGTLVSVLVVLMMLISVAQPVLSLNDRAPLDNTEQTEGTSAVNNGINTDSGETNSPVKSKTYSKVIVATYDVAELAVYLSNFDYDGIIGAQPSNRKGVAFPVLSVPPSAIAGIAALPDVLGVYDYVDPVTSSGTDGTAFSRSLLEMDPNSVISDSLNIEAGSLYHGAEEAWSNGFTGEGVKIATVTGGTDFGHPELAGRQATITNASSPYYGYPIAYDPTSMSSFVDSGLQASTLDPSDSWYVNTSSNDLRIYHTVVVDGVNDFWTEVDRHNSSQSVYSLTQTSEKKASDKAEDISAFELDLKGLYITSDSKNWSMGFDVTPVTDTWKRSIDVNYGLYIDTIPAAGATTDPKGNRITSAPANRPEYAIYFHHVSVDWGVGSDGKVWSNNNTVQNATFYSWFGGSWTEVTMTEDLPYNSTVGIGPTAGSHITKTADGQSFVSHNGEEYRLNSNNTIFYNVSGEYVALDMIKGIQKFTSDFVEFSMPREMIANAQSFSTILFTTGNNVSHAQDSVPSDAAVVFEDPAWDAGITTLSTFRIINAPPQYVVAGIPSISGNYRIGLHPDQNLNLQYGRPVAVLLTDYYESGKYDAIYVDLDNDKSFADEIPMMEYGAYNESLMIGPRWGTERYENNMIKHNNTLYTMKNYENVVRWSNKTLKASATGGEKWFTLGNTSVNQPTIVLDRPTTHDHTFANGTVDGVGTNWAVYNFTDPMTPWNFTLPHGNIINNTYMVLHYWDNATTHYYDNLLTYDPTITVDDTTGKVSFTDGYYWDLPATNWGCIEMFAWYQYTVPVNTGFTFNSANNSITLNEALLPGDYLNISYSYNAIDEQPITPAHRYGKIIYNSKIVELELRDWISNRDIDSDGGKGDGKFYPDLSGGMAYFISDGVSPIPYMDMFWEWNAIANENRKIPGNGDMIALFGEFGEASAQGTEVGTAISGMGTMLDGNGNALVKGMAPGAKLISIRGGSFASWYFAVEGYDGIVGTDDDAQIVAITSTFPVSNSGWDVYTKGAEYIGKYYAKGNVTFVAGTGDAGFGYGTVQSPGSSEATITAGQGTMFDYRNYKPKAPTVLARAYADGGSNPAHGDVLPSSGRGPNMLGNPEPDVITIGAFQFGGTPLNIDQAATTTDFEWSGGQWAWELWSGPAVAAANTAGILALIYGAYEQKTGSFPNNIEAKSLLRSGADNMNYDILTQGSGFSNADRSTKLAAGIDGIYLSRNYWVPGDYRGIRYEGFVKLMEPGETASETVTVTNKNTTAAANLQVYDSIYHKFGNYTFDMNITRTYDDPTTPGIINIEPFVAVGTELLKVTATSARKSTMQTYMAELFDWTDKNNNGLVNFPAEQNRMTYVIGTNSLELRYRDPIGRTADGLVVQVKGFGGAGEALNDWVITMEFFEKVDWSWLTLTGAPTTLAAGASSTFTMNLNVPTYADVGSYEGAVYINRKTPEEPVATGVGLLMKNVSFGWWASENLPESWAKPNDPDVTGGLRNMVPQTTKILWNGTALYEGVDYELDGTSGVHFFKAFNNATQTPIPLLVPYFNITYLTVLTDGSGNAIENATWGGILSIPNIASGNYTFRKDGMVWAESEAVIGESVVNATGGELRASLSNRNIVRNTATLYKNGTAWPQDGGLITEPTVTAIGGENTIQLAHGNVVPGTTTLAINSAVKSQTGEVSLVKKEIVQGLNSTALPASLNFADLGADTEGSLWNDTGVWYAQIPNNLHNVSTFRIVTYIIYDNGVPMTDGLHFTMHTGGTHGKVQFTNYLDIGHTYSVQYSYYNNSLQVGQLSHALIISDSCKLYKNGASLKITDFFVELETGIVTLADPLGPNEIIEAAYQYNVYLIDTRLGMVTLANSLLAGDTVDITFRYYVYTLDLPTGVLEFADPLAPGDVITADYSFGRYTMDLVKGIVMFASPLLPGEDVTCEYYYYSNVIPVFFNIGADKPDFSFGGPDTISSSAAKYAYDDLFRYNEIRGGYGNEGDWRFIFMDILEQGKYALPTANERLLVDVKWENDRSDVDVQVFGGRDGLPTWSYDPFPQDRYGPHSISFIGGSDETADFFTTTGGPEEITAPKISPGLNVIGLHTVGLNGSVDCTETFSAEVGTMYIDSTEIKLVTNQYVGETSLNMVSNKEWSGVGGIAAGPSAPEKLKNQTVTQDDPDWTKFDTFQDQLASGKTVYSRTIQDCLIFNVHIWGRAGVVDMDLGVFLDGSGAKPKNGLVEVDEFVAMCADADADEEVKLIAPKDGTYLIVPFGFTLSTNPALFDMDITIVQGTGFDVSGKGINSLPADQKGFFASNQTEEPYNQTNLKLRWDLPGSATGTLQGALYVGPGNGPMCMLVPIELTIDTTPPEISAPIPLENSYIMNRRPNIAISVSDPVRGELESTTMKLYLDGTDVTAQSSVSIPFLDADTDPVKGYPAGTATYVPNYALVDGAHVIKTVIKDKAGNIATKEWVFTVDSTAPYFEVTNPSEDVSYTNAASIDVIGYTEFGLEPKVIGATPSASYLSDDGVFTITLPLASGENSLILQTTDFAGNTKQILRSIFRDSVLPEFTSVRFSTGFTTNSPYTRLEGKMSEAGTMFVNGANIPVNGDGSFGQMLSLSEGRNTFHLEFTDRAGNMKHSWQNVTLDTVAPIVSLTTTETLVESQTFILAGTVEPGIELFVNGKRIDVGTRQSSSDFSTTLTLSPGLNTIVIEAQDSAGNIAELRHIVEYDTAGSGANYAAIGLMVALLVVGLVLGLFLGPLILGGKKEEMPNEVEPVTDVPEEIVPEIQAPEEPQETESDDSLESKPETESLEPIPTEESIPEELPDEVAPVEAESEELPSTTPVPAENEDPRIMKLTEAYKSGKISKELYEKNLARFKEQ